MKKLEWMMTNYGWESRTLTGIWKLGQATWDTKREKKKWLPDKTWKLIKERKCNKNKSLSAKETKVAKDLQEHYRVKDKEVKKNVRRQDKRNYIDETSEEAEEAARVNDIKKIYNITKQLSGKSQRQRITPVKDMNGEP